MDLEVMKTLWEEMSAEIEKQKKITGSLIIKMTRADYRNRINKILIPEAIGALVCFAGTFYILINFQRLSTWYLQACGIISALILFILPIVSVKAIHKMWSLNILHNTYKQSLLEYSKGKKQFVFVQKLSFYLGSILMLVVLPVMGQLIAGKDLFIVTRLWMWYAIGFPFFYWLAKWVFKSYIKSAADAENVLEELKD